MNEYGPTRRSADKDSRDSSPDITACTEDIALDTQWSILDTKLSSHYPIVVKFELDDLPSGSKQNRKSQLNFRKADWIAYRQCLEEETAKIQPKATVEAMESAFRKAVQKATSKAIPRGRHHQETPLVSKDVRSLITDRDRCKDSIEISALNNRIQQLLFKVKQERWNTFIEENKQLTSGKLWAAMAKMTGKRLRKKNCVIKFDGKEPKNSRDVANQFDKSLRAPAQ